MLAEHGFFTREHEFLFRNPRPQQIRVNLFGKLGDGGGRISNPLMLGLRFHPDEIASTDEKQSEKSGQANGCNLETQTDVRLP
ncbi:MAG: hypothetical protein R3D62_20425 [Xanthobacteraceae bacterium]